MIWILGIWVYGFGLISVFGQKLASRDEPMRPRGIAGRPGTGKKKNNRKSRTVRTDQWKLEKKGGGGMEGGCSPKDAPGVAGCRRLPSGPAYNS